MVTSIVTEIEERVVTETVIEEKIVEVEVEGEAPTTTMGMREAGLAAENGADLLIYAPPGREIPTQWPVTWAGSAAPVRSNRRKLRLAR